MLIKRQFLLIILILTTFFFSVEAQSDRKDDKNSEESRIGFGANIGNIRFYNTEFEFGLHPNIAYRFGESFAVGFMLKTDYFYKKYRDYAVKFSAFNFGPTVFARYKPFWSWDGAPPFLQGIFLQAEYEKGFFTLPAEYSYYEPVIEDGEVVRVKIQEDAVHLGLGLSSGYPFSTFFSIHYNALDDFESIRPPFTYRIGFTYNY